MLREQSLLSYAPPEGAYDLKRTIITLGSMTYAIKAKRLLGSIGIPSRLIKVDSTESKEGCQYGIEIPYAAFMHAIDILRSNRIPYSVSGTEGGNAIS